MQKWNYQKDNRVSFTSKCNIGGYATYWSIIIAVRWLQRYIKFLKNIFPAENFLNNWRQNTKKIRVHQADLKIGLSLVASDYFESFQICLFRDFLHLFNSVSIWFQDIRSSATKTPICYVLCECFTYHLLHLFQLRKRCEHWTLGM